jgi:hypothetical protein
LRACDLVSLLREARSQAGGEVDSRLRAAPRRVRAVEITAGREDRREPLRRMRVAGRVREAVRALGAGPVPVLLQQRSEVEGAICVAPLIGALVAGLRCPPVSAGLVDHAEVQRRASMTQFISLAIGELGAIRIAPLLEQDPELELLDGSTGAVDQCVHARRHLPAAFPTVLATTPPCHDPIDATPIATV